MAPVVGIPAAAVVLGVDVPLSLAGDVVTYPIARARKDGQPWATWWGEQAPANDTEATPPATETSLQAAVKSR